MAEQKTVVLKIQTEGTEKVIKNIADINKAVDSGATELADLGKKAGASFFSLEQQIEAVNKLGFGKALSQGFIQTREEIIAVNAVLQKQAADTDAGTEAFAKNKAAAEASQKAVEKLAATDAKAAKDQEKAIKDAEKEAAKARSQALKDTLDKQGFAKSFADGTIKSLTDIEAAFYHLKKTKPLDDKDFLAARDAMKTYGSVFREFGADTEELFNNFKQGFVTINKETGEATTNTEALNKKYEELNATTKETLEETKQLGVEFQKLTIPKLKLKLNETSRTQLEKEFENLKALAEKAQPGTAAYDELQAKIKLVGDELEKDIVKPFSELSIKEVGIKVSKQSKADLEKQKADLEAVFAEAKQGTQEYSEAAQKLKLVNKALMDVERTTEAIADLDLSQAYIDIGTKGVEGLANASRAVGAFSGNVKEAEEVAAQFDKVLQALAVVQSLQDGFKAFSETLKGTNGSFLSAATGAKVFKFALAATGIGAVVLALSLLISNFGGLKKVLSIAADGFSAVQDSAGAIFTTFKENIPLLIEFVKNAGLAVLNFLTLPLQTVARTATALFDVVTGKKGIKAAFADQFNGLLDPALKAFESGKELFGKAGTAFSDAFGKSFDTRQALRDNEQKKILLETLNAQRAARKSALDAQISDATLSFEQQKKLAKESIALEKASVADSLALNQQRVKLLSALGANLSEEQRDELKQLKADVAQQQADLIAIQVNADQKIRDLLVASQEQKLLIIQKESDKTVEILERQLANENELRNKSLDEEVAIINQIQDARLTAIEAEMKAIRDRGKLTLDESNQLADLEKAKGDLAIETNARIKESVTRRIDDQIQLEQTLADIQAKRFEIEASKQATAQAQEDQRTAKVQRDLAVQEKTLNSFADIQAHSKTQLDSINHSYEFQQKILLQNLTTEKQRLAIEKTNVELQESALKARAHGRELTEQELADLESLQADLDKISQTSQNLDINFGIDKDKLKADTDAAIDQTGKDATAAAKAKIADPLGSTLREALTSAFKIDNETADQLISGFSGVVDQVVNLVGQINQAQIKGIEDQQAQIAQAMQDADDRISQTQEKVTGALQAVDDLQGKLEGEQGARRDALIAQIQGQQQAVADLTKQEKAAQAQKVKLQQQNDALDKEKLEKQKEQAKIELVIKTALAYANAAVAIANAFNLPPPVGLIEGAVATITILASVASAIASTVQLAGLRMGGRIPKAAGGMLLQGASHEQGGIQINVGGRPAVEAEGGEIVLTKGVANDPDLFAAASRINVAGGGNPIAKLAGGGIVNSSAAENAIKVDDQNNEKFEALQRSVIALAGRETVVSVQQIVKATAENQKSVDLRNT